ncbi:MAG: glycogen/starch/alpha-glucan phosphorylase [Chlamydiales bacterium]|nr:glycogen/starch/alpha-glucan phosphorylase [Chlamydiales bacterium]
MKLAINGALTIGTEDGANIEMRQSIGDAAWPFRFGKTEEENKEPYKSRDIYLAHPNIQHAVNALKEGHFAQSAGKRELFDQIYHYLIEDDTYRMLQDLPDYYKTQKKVEELFLPP